MPKDYATWASRWRVRLGFALAAAYLILAQPSVVLLLSGAAIMLAGLLLRAWSAGYLAKNQRLATGGPYSYTRNPLYLGSAVMGLGGRGGRPLVDHGCSFRSLLRLGVLAGDEA